jgi:hypothetical protein
MIHVLDKLTRSGDNNPNHAAQWTAATRVVKTMTEEEQSLYNLLKVIELGSHQLAHEIDGGCQGDKSHMRGYGYMAECWEFLFSRGISQSMIDRVTDCSEEIDRAMREAG